MQAHLQPRIRVQTAFQFQCYETDSLETSALLLLTSHIVSFQTLNVSQLQQLSSWIYILWLHPTAQKRTSQLLSAKSATVFLVPIQKQ